ncbi:MAG TPA: glycosyltransferase [Steroidobacteraceae bacterium]|nr:glycosyltransferase [Steroidobacteraceae bacterium]
MGQKSSPSDTVGVVVIGRNEGERLKRCLTSLLDSTQSIVYVDSGSTDGSVAMSLSMGLEVVELDLRTAFTAARARNEGFWHLVRVRPDLRYVFFVDGDCEVIAGWVDVATRFLDSRPDVAAVCGRLRERYPEKSVYNLLCDIEWESFPLGDAKMCGGNAVMRIEAVRQVNGFRADLICGEEPELCVRLRQKGWRIWQLETDMALHDAALYHFSQWWKRMVRGGYAYAQGAREHGAPPEEHWVEESRRIWAWGLLIPLGVLILALTLDLRLLWFLAIYPLQVIRLAVLGPRSWRENWVRAVALVLCKFPEMLGQLKFLMDKQRRVQSSLIEYK